MKKIYNIVAILCVSLFFSSCESEDHGVDSNNYTGTPFASFTNGTSGSYFVTPTSESFKIQIGATNTSDVDRTYRVIINETSTASDGVEFSLASNEVIIPAGEYFGEIIVNGIFAGTTSEGSDLVLNITSTENEVMMNSTYTLNIVQKCISDLAGNYSVTTTYGYHDFLPNYNPNTAQAEIIAIDQEAGLYEVFDFSGGLYSVGPYSSAYGTSDFVVQFTENCGQITWENQSDPWGAVIPLDGGVNSVDYGAGGVVTISWFCEGYGENGVSIYTPQ